MSEPWQPIETAPKDGSEIDLWCMDIVGEGFRATNCSWNPTFGNWQHRDYPITEAFMTIGVYATHWMPIPPSPRNNA